MSKSGLFAHFESKEDLQLQVLETARAHFIETVVSRALREARGDPLGAGAEGAGQPAGGAPGVSGPKSERRRPGDPF